MDNKCRDPDHLAFGSTLFIFMFLFKKGEYHFSNFEKDMHTASVLTYGNCSKILNTFLILFSNKKLVTRAGSRISVCNVFLDLQIFWQTTSVLFRRDTDIIPPGQNPPCSFLYTWTKSPP